MNSTDSQLERLFRSAARASHPLPLEAPFSLEMRVVRALRRGLEEERVLLLPLVRGAFVCACAIMLVTAALTIHSLMESQPDELVIVDSVIRLTLMQ